VTGAVGSWCVKVCVKAFDSVNHCLLGTPLEVHNIVQVIFSIVAGGEMPVLVVVVSRGKSNFVACKDQLFIGCGRERVVAFQLGLQKTSLCFAIVFSQLPDKNLPA